MKAEKLKAEIAETQRQIDELAALTGDALNPPKKHSKQLANDDCKLENRTLSATSGPPTQYTTAATPEPDKVATPRKIGKFEVGRVYRFDEIIE